MFMIKKLFATQSTQDLCVVFSLKPQLGQISVKSANFSGLVKNDGIAEVWDDNFTRYHPRFPADIQRDLVSYARPHAKA